MRITQIAALTTLTIISSGALAVDSSFSGFAQLTVGRVLNGATDGSVPYQINAQPGYSYKCPCFTANYEYVGLYEYHKTQVQPESLAGLQGNFKFTPDLSATVQVVARGADSSVNADWAYGSYRINENLTLQAGRKRLPLYYYSDYMYVGYAYPWLRPSQDLYAWQIYSYDGANLLYSNNVGDWTYTGNVWVGKRKSNDNQMLGNLYYTSRIDESWNKMIGAYLDASNDIFSVRGVYMHTVVERYSVINGVRSPAMSGANGQLINDVGQAFYGLSFNIDYKNWLMRSEINYIDRPSVKNTFTAQSYSGGYKFDQHSLMLSWSQFAEHSDYWPTGTEKHHTTSLTYRWDFATSQALKVQYDKVKDKSKFQFTGDASLLSASWQMVF